MLLFLLLSSIIIVNFDIIQDCKYLGMIFCNLAFRKIAKRIETW